MARVNIKGANKSLHFENVDEWIDYARAKVLKTDCSLTEITDFSGKYSGYEMIKRIANRQCLEDVKKQVHEKSLSLPPLSTEQEERESLTFFNDQNGLFLDTTAYFNGDDDCMINYEIAETTRPVIWIACCYGANANVEQLQFTNRGVALIRTVHALESAGVSVGIVAYQKAEHRDNGKLSIETVVVKQPNNALDETTLINIFADKNAFRTITFALINVAYNCDKAINKTSATKAEISDFDNSYAKGHRIVLLPYDNMDLYEDADKATDWTVEQVKKQAELTF